MTTLIDVVDSAVKIGLGAAISGLATYVTVVSKYKQDIQLETLRREREILEEAAEYTEHFTNSVLRRWAVMTEMVRVRDRGGKISDELKEKAKDASSDVSNNANYLVNAEAKLLLLGYVESQNLLRNYGESAIQFVRRNWHVMADIDEAKLDELKSELLGMRRELFVSLSREYRRLSSKKTDYPK